MVVCVMTNKDKYRKFCESEKNIPIFSKDWWLDCVCGENNWDVLLVEKGGVIWASMPYYKTKSFLLTKLDMPKLTQTLGPYIKYPKGQSVFKRLTWEKEITLLLIEQIPDCDVFHQNFHYNFTNWLPFYWNDYKQTTKYTYVIENLSIEKFYQRFSTGYRGRMIKKAEKSGIKVIESDDVEKFYELNLMTFERQNKKMPYCFKLVEKIYKTCRQRDACKMFFSIDKDGDVVAASFLIEDENSVYFLMGGINTDKKVSNGMDLAVFNSIKHAIVKNKKFDFEGSMIEGVERYFRSFYAEQKPYHKVFKINSKLYQLKKCLKELLKC